jgi:hypothetical protein
MKTRWGLCAVFGLVSAALAGDGLKVKTGLWEVTYTTQVKGSMIPAASLAQMPPERRAQVEAAMKKRAAQGPHSATHRNCVTAKDLEQGAFNSDPSEHCTNTVVKQTANHQEVTVVCKDGDETRRGRMVIDAPSADRMTGTVDMATDEGSMNMQLAGKWLGASCAGAEKD